MSDVLHTHEKEPEGRHPVKDVAPQDASGGGGI